MTVPPLWVIADRFSGILFFGRAGSRVPVGLSAPLCRGPALGARSPTSGLAPFGPVHGCTVCTLRRKFSAKLECDGRHGVCISEESRPFLGRWGRG